MRAHVEIENTDPKIHENWMKKHGFVEGVDGKFDISQHKGKDPEAADVLFAQIAENAKRAILPLTNDVYDDRTFVMVCGGPSVENYLEEIREKVNNRDEYLVVCSNMTADYLMSHKIIPHVHFIIDPKKGKAKDVANANPTIQYWINLACHPAVFEVLEQKHITPYVFLAEFEGEGKGMKTAVENLRPETGGIMGLQGGTMAGLRALTLADALGFRRVEMYGFDATANIKDGKAQLYAYPKKRGEAIIEVECDKCGEKFPTTLVLQNQVNEFLFWRKALEWIDIKIIGGGLISHYVDHIPSPEWAEYRWTEEYKQMQLELHKNEKYGNTGKQYAQIFFQAISQLAKKHDEVTVLDYGAAKGRTVSAIQKEYWIPPHVSFYNFDPFVEEYAGKPQPATFVICTDVMEHVEPECTIAVLDHIQYLTKNMVFFSISLTPAKKTLPDGRNAHINLRDPEFWLRKIRQRFILSEASVRGGTLFIVGQAIGAVRRSRGLGCK